MPQLPTWTGRSSFKYTGSVSNGTVITYGSGFKVTVSAADYSALIKNFSGSTVDIGTSRGTARPRSLGDWLQRNITKTAIASYVGPILINEGYAVKIGRSQIWIY